MVIVIGGKKYLKIQPPWVRGYRPATIYKEIQDK